MRTRRVPQELQGLLDDPDQVHGLDLHGLRPGQVQEILHELADSEGLPLDGVQILKTLGAQGRDLPAGPKARLQTHPDKFGPCGDDSGRRVDLVGNPAGQLPQKGQTGRPNELFLRGQEVPPLSVDESLHLQKDDPYEQAGGDDPQGKEAKDDEQVPADRLDEAPGKLDKLERPHD
jgi:hypothetical protein